VFPFGITKVAVPSLAGIIVWAIAQGLKKDKASKESDNCQAAFISFVLVFLHQ
jgi:hypothetical protein